MCNASDSAVDLLVTHGARRMADDGWQGADLVAVVAEAGLDDPGAVAYHFGSREGLMLEVLGRGIALLAARGRAYVQAKGDDQDETLEQVWDSYSRPMADMLLDAHERDILRINGQLCTLAAPGLNLSSGPVVGTALEYRWRRMVALLAERVGQASAQQRLGWVVVMLGSVLGARGNEVAAWAVAAGVAERIGDALEALDAEARRRGRPTHEEFVDWLQRSLLGVLTA